MKDGYSEPYPTSSKKESSSNDDDDEDDDESEDRVLDHALHFDSPSSHHYVVGAKSLNYVMQ